MSGKIGAGHAEAMFRLGLRELRNAANPSRESVADNEIGLYGSQTQGEIAAARGGPGQGPEQESGDSLLSLAQLRDDAKTLGRDHDRDNGNDRGRDCDGFER
jgi:hypothetical protein